MACMQRAPVLGRNTSSPQHLDPDWLQQQWQPQGRPALLHQRKQCFEKSETVCQDTDMSASAHWMHRRPTGHEDQLRLRVQEPEQGRSAPGMPCRLWTPQVSRKPILASRKGMT